MDSGKSDERDDDGVKFLGPGIERGPNIIPLLVFDALINC